MSDSRASAGLDRLPWLADEPKPQPKTVKRDIVVWTVVAVLLIAGAYFWLSGRNETVPASRNSPVAVTNALPRPTSAEQLPVAAQPQVAPAPMPDVRQLAAPEVHISPPPRKTIRHRSAGHAVPVAKSVPEPRLQVVAAAPAAPAVLPVARSAPLRPWPSRITSGAYGRLVQIGAYGSRFQAKRGWVAMVRSYPAVAHLSAVVVETHNSHRRLFYRFQIGTTSQAHSEVLCQRMEKIKLSCAIIGLPWKAKIER